MVMRDERGALLVPFLLLTTIAAFSGYGIWGMLRACKNRVETQLRLDECVGRKALELKAMLKTLTSSNTRMKWVRRSALIAVLAPEALEAIRVELEIELALQEGLRLKWRAFSIAAVAGRACPGLKASAIRYPLLEWNRLPADAIGPQAFEWVEYAPRFDLLLVASSQRFTDRASFQGAARVQEDQNGKDSWIARWTNLR